MAENKQTTPKEEAPAAPASANFEKQIIAKIDDAENILVALSRNPTVDEMAAAIGLTLFLNQTGKHVTAIYSGQTPNVLEFLKPEGTFEDNTDSLQDFIIALNKEKADHLRYKLDGDYVKIYITPYKTTISEKDLEFSHGDYNVDLVVALDVPTASDLDTALHEHGRIMHDASAINITAGEAGKFGEIEWSDAAASSVSEMVGRLMMRMTDKELPISKEEATALMTGIMAATQRFSNEKTTPEVMNLAGKLMELGADQKLIANNIENQVALMGAVEKGRVKSGGTKSGDEGAEGAGAADVVEEKDPTVLNIREEVAAQAVKTAEAGDEASAPVETSEAPVTAEPVAADVGAASVPVADAGMAALANAGAGTGESVAPVAEAAAEPLPIPMPETIGVENGEEGVEPKNEAEGGAGGIVPTEGEKVLIPPPEEPQPEVKDYGAMIDAALAEGVPAGPTEAAPITGAEATVGAVPEAATPEMSAPMTEAVPAGQAPVNPAAAAAPTVPAAPEEDHLPELDYGVNNGAGVVPEAGANVAAPTEAGAMPTVPAADAGAGMVPAGTETAAAPAMPSAEQGTNGVLPMPSSETLPPPPTPPVDFSNVPTSTELGGGLPPVADATGQVAGATMGTDVVGQTAAQPVGVDAAGQVAQPVGQAAGTQMEAQPVTAGATDPGAFKIPGM